MTDVQNDKNSIEISYYADKINFDLESNQITETQTQELFSLIVEDFIKNSITLDDLSVFCGLFYSKLPQSSKLFTLMLDGAEIEWYMRHSPRHWESAISDLIQTFSKEVSKDEYFPNNDTIKYKLPLLKKDRLIDPKTDKLLQLIEKYANVVGSSIIDTGHITEAQAIDTIKCVMSEFVEFQLEVEDICDICNILYYSLPQNAAILPLIDEATRMNWNFRHDPEKACNTLDKFLKNYTIPKKTE